MVNGIDPKSHYRPISPDPSTPKSPPDRFTDDLGVGRRLSTAALNANSGRQLNFTPADALS